MEVRLNRERRARLESETIAESAMRKLYASERKLEILQAIAAASNAATSVEPAILIALERTCAYTGWPVGHAYIARTSTGGLEPTDLWHTSATETHERFRASSRGICFLEGCGLPGGVFATGRAEWFIEPGFDDRFLRAEAAREAGFRSAMAFPVVVQGDVVAVLEFFSQVAQAPDESALAIMEYIGVQLGRVIERTRAGEALLEVYRHAEKLAAMGSMLAGVAHELNNPLSVIAGEAALLEREIRDDRPLARVNRITQASVRCARIVRNFLDLARQRSTDRTEASLNEIVQGALEILAYQLRLDDITVDWQPAIDLPLIWADTHQIHQLVVNLVTNAHHALRQAPAPRRLALSTHDHPDRGRVILQVEDTGCGIRPEILGRIFDPFFTTRESGQGTGLGLSLCKGIAEDHGGTITAASPPGRGATFCVELPAAAYGLPRPETSPEPAVTTSTVVGLRILVVEDEPEVAEILADMLKLDGHEIDFAADGWEALKHLRSHEYDLILSDMRMPHLDGVGLYRELQRELPQCCRRVIFISGDAMSKDLEAFFREVGSTAIGKPISIDQVRAAIREALLAG